MSKTTNSPNDASGSTTTWRLIGTDANGLEYFKTDKLPKCLFITEPSGGRTTQHADPDSLLSEGSLVELELHEDTRGSLTGLSHMLRAKGVKAPKRDTFSCATDGNGDGYIAARWGERSICFHNRPAVTNKSNDDFRQFLTQTFPPGSTQISDSRESLRSHLTAGKVQVFIPTDVKISKEDIMEGYMEQLVAANERRLENFVKRPAHVLIIEAYGQRPPAPPPLLGHRPIPPSRTVLTRQLPL